MASLKDFEPLVSNRTRQLVDLLGSKKGEVNLSKWFSWFTYVLRPAPEARGHEILTAWPVGTTS